MLVNARGNIDPFQAIARTLLVEVFIKVMKDELFSDDSRGRQEILMCLAAHSQYFSPVDSQYIVSHPLRMLTQYLCPLR